jgi:hypothetical protein
MHTTDGAARLIYAMNPEIASISGKERSLPKFEITGFATPRTVLRIQLGTIEGSHDTQARRRSQAWQICPAASILQAIGTP